MFQVSFKHFQSSAPPDHYFIMLSWLLRRRRELYDDQTTIKKGELERRPCGRRSDNFHFFNYFLCRKVGGDQGNRLRKSDKSGAAEKICLKFFVSIVQVPKAR